MFAPTDAAFDEFSGAVTADLLKHHVINGKVASGNLANADLATLQGSALKHNATSALRPVQTIAADGRPGFS